MLKNKLNIRPKIVRKILQVPQLGHLLSYYFTDEGKRLQQMISHRNINVHLKIKEDIEKDILPTNKDLVLTKRLLKAYRKALFDGRKEKSTLEEDMWTFLKRGPHADLFELLRTEDIKALALYLCNMSRMGITHGITQGAIEFRKIISNNIYRRWLTLFNLDKLISLAEAFGLIPLENPEQSDFRSSVNLDVDKLVDKIEKYLNIQILPPNIEGCLYRLSTKKGGIHYRDMAAIYTSWRCKEILKNIEKPSICEIGAGIGKSAYYCYLMGIKNYTIIDLPYINILQGFYLIKSLPSANIYLYGEDKEKENSISILPAWSLKKMNGKQFDMTLNQDSFPEIDRKTVIEYLKQIGIHKNNFFLSINQESQNTMMVGDLRQHIVSDLVYAAKNFELIYRFPYWMRIGYVEELYKVINKNN